MTQNYFVCYAQNIGVKVDEIYRRALFQDANICICKTAPISAFLVQHFFLTRFVAAV